MVEVGSKCLHGPREHEWREHVEHGQLKRWSKPIERSGLKLEEWRPLRKDLPHITNAIEASRYLLTLVDEDDQPACSRDAYERAITFLSACARRAWDAFGMKIDAPLILLGPDRSVDLHWKKATYEMLINVPADSAVPLTYYGDDVEGNSAKGTIASSDNLGVLTWLTKRK